MHILVVDDNDALRNLTGKRLIKAGYSVEEASNGKEALEKANNKKPDLAIVDLMMPIMDGIELCTRLRADNDLKLIYIIMLTAKDKTTDIINGYTLCDEYITKPYNMDEFLARVAAGARLKKVQDQLAEKNIALQNALQQQAYFLGMATHDLRSPLSIINTYISLLGQDIVTPEEIKETCQRRANGMMQLIDDLLDLSNIQAGRIELNLSNKNIVLLLEESVNLFAPVAREKDISITFMSPAEPINCLCDAVRFTDLVAALLDNAIRYSHGKTTITLESKKEDSNAVITVKDQGNGILKENLKYIFKPFANIESTTDSQENHTGLGLAIASKLAILHQGSLIAESAGIGKGSTFQLKIPLLSC